MKTVVYQDEAFDSVHYPIQDWMLDRLDQFIRIMNLQNCDTTWYYWVTIHGVGFQLHPDNLTLDHAGDSQGRLQTAMMVALSRIPNLRWVDIRKSRVEFGLTHIEQEIVPGVDVQYPTKTVQIITPVKTPEFFYKLYPEGKEKAVGWTGGTLADGIIWLQETTGAQGWNCQVASMDLVKLTHDEFGTFVIERVPFEDDDHRH